LLVPKPEIQAINKIEQKARKVVSNHAMPFGISSSFFVPAAMLPTMQQQIDELRIEFFERVDSFIVRFDDLVATARESHPEFWERCLKGHYPSDPKSLRSHYSMELFTFKIGSIDHTSERTQELQKQMQGEVKKFAEEYVKSMRAETIQFCNLMEARINGTPFGDEAESKQLTAKSISCFRNHLKRFREMNIFEDNEIETTLNNFNNTFLGSGISPKDLESATVKNSITSALQKIREKAAAEGDSGSKFIGELKRRIVL
jgi:hypothetical protein